MQPGAVKNREGHAPDPNDDGLNPANNQNSSESDNGGGFWQPEGWDDEYPGDEVARPNKNSSAPNIANEEANATPGLGNLASGGLNSPEKDMSAAAAMPKIDTSKLSTPATGMNKVIIRGITRKRATQIGGGMGGIGLLIAMYMAGASLYLVHLKEYVSGANNRFDSTISNQMQRRRVNSTFRILRKGVQKIQTAKFLSKAEAAGFEVTIEKGAVKSIKKGDVLIEIAGKSDRQLAKEVKSLAKGSKGEAGRLFISSLDNISKEVGSRFVGPVAKRSVYKRIFGLSGFFDWIGARKAIREGPNAKGVVEELTPAAEISDALTSADSTQRSILNSLDADELAKLLGVDPNTLDPATTVDDLVQQYGEEASKFRENLTGAKGQQVLKTAGQADIPSINDNLDEIGQVLTRTPKEKLLSTFTALAGKVNTKLKSKALDVLKGGIDPTNTLRQGCRAAGTLEFVKSVRNTLMAIELAKFAVKFYTIADHQRAGLASNTAIKLMSIYLAGATGSSGVQSIVAGAGVSAAGISAYGTGYADVGILAAIAAFLRSVPGLEPSTCRVINNPLTMIAGTLTGGALAAFSGGATSTALGGFSLGWSVALTVAGEIGYAIALPILIGSVSGALIDGFEQPGEQTGNLLASSVGALGTMTTGSSGGLPISSVAFAEAANETDTYRKEDLDRRSFAERYLDINNSDSLVARASLYMPQSLPGLGLITQKQFSFSNITNTFSSLFSSFSEPTFAATNSCEDVSAVKFNVQTDAFCNPVLAYVPILDLDQTEKILKDNNQITITGDPLPGSDYEKFVANCFSGRTGILHPIEVNQEGETDPIDPTCVVGTNEGSFTGSYPGDSPEEIEEGQTERVPLIKERFAAWYGFKVDEENLSADINDELSGTASKVGETNSTKIFFLGDSLTVGMQNLAGTDQAGDYLQRAFNVAGWTSQADAQGCRAVYQTLGPIQGDGSSCPAQTIIDGISAVKSKVALFENDQIGTVVIGLGTNRYELDDSGVVSNQLFLDKARELIDSIKQMSPSATIYWVNLTSQPENQELLDRNDALKQLIESMPETSKVKLLDWNDYVHTANATPSTTDDIGFADSVHHTADGYTKKVQYLLDNIPLPTPGGVGPITTATDTDSIPCAAGLGEGSVVTGHDQGAERKIRICDTGEGEGNIRGVNSQLSGAVDKMIKDAASDGINLSGGAYRSIDAQISLWKQRCGPDYPITEPWDSQICSGAQLARPGRSMHQLGLAIDLNCDGNLILSTDSPCFLWLEKNAVNYGLYEWGNNEKLAVSPERNKGEYEPWHWSINGN